MHRHSNRSYQRSEQIVLVIKLATIASLWLSVEKPLHTTAPDRSDYKSTEADMKALQIHGAKCHLRSMHRVAPRAQRNSRLKIMFAAQLEKYKPPSSSTASTELEYLEQYTTVVPDTLLLQNIEEIEAPKAATVSSAVLAGILRTPSALQDYKVLAT